MVDMLGEGEMTRVLVLRVLRIPSCRIQGELTVREVNLHNQKLVLESVLKELEDTKQTIDRFRCTAFLLGWYVMNDWDELWFAVGTNATAHSGRRTHQSAYYHGVRCAAPRSVESASNPAHSTSPPPLLFSLDR